MPEIKRTQEYFIQAEYENAGDCECLYCVTNPTEIERFPLFIDLSSLPNQLSIASMVRDFNCDEHWYCDVCHHDCYDLVGGTIVEKIYYDGVVDFEEIKLQ